MYPAIIIHSMARFMKTVVGAEHPLIPRTENVQDVQGKITLR